MKTGIELFTEEREKQIYKHGFTGKHHFNHPEWYNERQLIQAATLLTLEDLSRNTWCPKNWDEKWFFDLCNRSYSERLVISGALIASEIDRLTYKHATEFAEWVKNSSIKNTDLPINVLLKMYKNQKES